MNAANTPPPPIYMFNGKQVSQLEYFELTEKNTRAKFFDCPMVKDRECGGCKLGIHVIDGDTFLPSNHEQARAIMSVYAVAFVISENKIIPYAEYMDGALMQDMNEYSKRLEYLKDGKNIRHVVSQLRCQMCSFGHMTECHYPHGCDSDFCNHYKE